ncbi:replicative DNA helicase [Patescibacteria group bacterium]
MEQRVPPQNLEMERQFLGAILVDQEAIFKVSDAIRPGDFYRQAHTDIFEAMLELNAKREPIDLATLANRLQEMGRLESVGGRTYLSELAADVSTAAHVAHYAGVIQKKATLRRLITAAGEISELAHGEEEDVDILLDQAEKKLYGVSRSHVSNVFTPIKDALDEAFERIDMLHREKGKLRGTPTSYKDLDNVLGGMQKSDLLILAARPSVGKTSFALDIARAAAVQHNIPVGIFSLEMSKDQLVDRMLCAEANVDLWKLRRGMLSDQDGENGDFARIGHALGKLADAPIFIDDTANINVMEIRSKARRLQSEHGLGLLVVDYLQLMESRGRAQDNRTQEVAEMSRALKGIARELDIPVVALSQLSRVTEQSKPAIPKLSHLRDSGSIEQDADVVVFIYRKAADRNYRLEEIPLEERYLAEVIVAKHRNGPTGTVKLYFDEQRVSFRDLDKKMAVQSAPPPPAEQAAQASAGQAPVGAALPVPNKQKQPNF